MSFLDNLENSLKSLESQQERDPSEAKRREEERARSVASAPWAEKLKSAAYTKDLFDKAAAAGHRMRTKVYMTWFDSTLRLEARGRVLELKPTATGVVSEYVDSAGEARSEAVDLDGTPDEMLERWLK